MDDVTTVIIFLGLYTVIACAWCYVAEKRAEKKAAQQPRMPPDHCVQEAEKVLFRYQYRMVHGQPVDEEL